MTEDELTLDEICEALEAVDPSTVRAALIAVLRDNNGAALRELLAQVGARSDPRSRKLYEHIISIPELHDLIPH
jgi:hypothetical protein